MQGSVHLHYSNSICLLLLKCRMAHVVGDTDSPYGETGFMVQPMVMTFTHTVSVHAV